jgi:hypothetical protein
MNPDYLVEFSQVEKANVFFQGVYTWLSNPEIEGIWGEDSEHILTKWRESHHNPWEFYSSLDFPNRRKLVDWYNKKMRPTVTSIGR